MGLLHLLIAALAASAATAADPPCACVAEVQTIDPIKNPMIFFQQPTFGGSMSGKTCSMSCNFVASLDANADENTSLQIQILTNQLGDGRMTVDGMNDTVTITSTTPVGLMYPRSVGTSITIHFTEGSTNDGTFMIVVQKVTGRPLPPVTKAPVTVAPTSPYDQKFTHNPLLVANDIMLAFDLSSGDIEQYKTFARSLIKELTIIPKSLTYAEGETEDCGVGSRLSLVGLSALNGFDNLYAPYWTTSAEQADGNIGSFVQIGSGDFFFVPVRDKYIHGFSQSAYTKCANKEKIFILLSSTSPQEYDSNVPGTDPLNINFLNESVHQILVYYKLNDTDKKFYTLSGDAEANNAWNFFQLSGGPDDVKNFANSFLVDSTEQMTCQIKYTNQEREFVDVVLKKADDLMNMAAEVKIPPYYDAKLKPDDPSTKWETARHYCNFQDTTVRIIKDTTLSDPNDPDGKSPRCVTVYYDLETGKDYVSIFSGDPDKPDLQEEIVRLTGRDISGTSFDLPDAFGSIVFSSDEKNVYDGFYAKIKEGACTP